MSRWAGFRALATRPSVALFTLLFGFYAYFYQAGGWNQNSRFDLVRAVVEDGSLRIDRFHKNTGDTSVRNGHSYCDKAPGSSWLCVPTYALVHKAAGSPKDVSPSLLAWGVWLSIVVGVGVPSAIAAVFLARLARVLGVAAHGSMVIALGWGLGSMALPYATLLYGNQLAAAFTIIAFTLLVEIKVAAPGADKVAALPTARRMFAIGALLGLACASEYPAALIAGPVGLYGLHVVGVRRAAWGIVGGLLPLAALLGYHAAAFGSPFAFPYDYSVWKEPHTGWFMGISKPVGSSLRSILVGESRGLLSTTPWLALALPGGLLLARRHRAEVVVCVSSVLGFLWLNSSIPASAGGWAAGPRYLVPMLPFVAMLAGGFVIELERCIGSNEKGERLMGIAGAVALAGVLALSASNMFAATAVKPEIATSWQRPYAEFVWPSFGDGRLAVSTQSIDMIDNPANAPRQAWNLGMKLGLDGLASLAPLGVWTLLSVMWLGWAVGAEARYARRRASPP